MITIRSRRQRGWWIIAALLGLGVFDCPRLAHAETPYSTSWTRQLGSTAGEESSGVSADGLGNVYLSGYTDGALPGGGGSAGSYDAFVSKYDAAGTLAWTRQLGSATVDQSYGVSADGLGNVYISGATNGALPGGGGSAGSYDAFVSKYDAAGTLAWTRQLGSTTSDGSLGVSADGLGNVYLSGATNGALPGGGGSAGGFDDAFVSKYDASGALAWTRQLGSTAFDRSRGVSADGLGNVYISGATNGALPGGGGSAGGYDAFVSKYDASGTLAWTRQLGSTAFDQIYGVSADGLGNAYISGYTDGALPGGGGSAGSYDAFVSKYDASGALAWTRQLGSATVDQSYGVSADGLGNVYISGLTNGALPGGGGSAGGYDAFVVKLSPVPEPATFLLSVLAALGLAITARRTRPSAGHYRADGS